MRKKKTHSLRGFALAETVVALALITVISVATLTMFRSSINASKRAIDKS